MSSTKCNDKSRAFKAPNSRLFSRNSASGNRRYDAKKKTAENDSGMSKYSLRSSYRNKSANTVSDDSDDDLRSSLTESNMSWADRSDIHFGFLDSPIKMRSASNTPVKMQSPTDTPVKRRSSSRTPVKRRLLPDPPDKMQPTIKKLLDFADKGETLDKKINEAANSKDDVNIDKKSSRKRILDDTYNTDYPPLNYDSGSDDCSTRRSVRQRLGKSEHTNHYGSQESPKLKTVWQLLENVGSDGLSTASSSMHSSDTELDSDKSKKQFETDPAVLKRRQKQIDYGKNTKGYKLYLKAVPKIKREASHIHTPKKHIKYSRRSWDCQVKIWRKRLHDWDPESEEEDADVDLSNMIAMLSPK